MAARLRPNALSTACALAAIAVMSWLGLYGFAWTDYDFEAAPAFFALTHGHVTRFVGLLPAYGGSLELRAPFALLPGLFGGGELAVYRAVALPCLLASAILGVWLVSRMRADGHTRLARAVALGLCVANPITLSALEIGHPEELLGGVLCVAAVLLAARNHPILAGLALGLAIPNKEWALLGFGPVLLALPGGAGHVRARVSATLVAGSVTVALLLPILIVHAGADPPPIAVAQAGAIFRPEQVFWFAGRKGPPIPHGRVPAHRPGYRVSPKWLTGLAHPLIIALALPLTLLCRRRRRHRLPGDALLLLALVLLLRCVLDPWDNVYYPLPFLLALLAWETSTRRVPPVFSLAASAAVWVVFVWAENHVAADLISAATLALALPAAATMSAVLYGRREPHPHAATEHRRVSAWPLSRRPATPS